MKNARRSLGIALAASTVFGMFPMPLMSMAPRGYGHFQPPPERNKRQNFKGHRGKR